MLLHASNIFELTYSFTTSWFSFYKIAINTNFTARHFFISIRRKSQVSQNKSDYRFAKQKGRDGIINK